MNLMPTIVNHAADITKNGDRWIFIQSCSDDIIMEIGVVRSNGIRERPHATRKYYEKGGEVTFITYPHC